MKRDRGGTGKGGMEGGIFTQFSHLYTLNAAYIVCLLPRRMDARERGEKGRGRRKKEIGEGGREEK